ncbi:MAG TPA: gephyrin-like molybdotransferase Glp [Acidimicrobiales bacterium]|nr:gephyrin-like molybdotransferase Glp [Acidimicrobiales bacterium]
MIPLEEARQFVLASCSALAPRSVLLDDALGCVLGVPIVASEPVPPFTNSSMDGYALRAQDTRGAPVSLEVVGSISAGHPFDATVKAGQAVRIMTGAPLPPGADAVVMIEETRALGYTVTIEREIEAGDFVRQSGLDVAVGELVAEAGTVLTPAYLGVLADQGVTSVVVHPRPRVGVLSSGDELVEAPGPLLPGKIRDANRHTLLALSRREGWECVDLGIVGDDEAAIVDVLTHAATICDAVVTSGGVSVGDHDLVRVVLEKLSARTMRWMQVAIRPAKPLAFGTFPDTRTPVFGLPGNPVSAIVSFELFVRPALRILSGYRSLDRPIVAAVAEADVRRRPDGKLHLLRARVTLDRLGTWRVTTAQRQESHQLHAMAKANALALIPDGTGVPAGDSIKVMLIDPDELATVPLELS